ncbi:lysophospholipid acyltransferase family protein [Rhizobium rhizosphaerae]|uniref:lysophospholipid acyltransferase family protein n=1 Tax=Xaviernesmea rhizosphaerae TaxID=1672749 RepID=UPI00098EC5CC|nr:hypothetical protein [Xaviernesmea rhizosphaerae]
MATEPKRERQPKREIRKRAWIWRPPDAVPLADLWSGEAGKRRAARRVWIADSLQDGFDILLFYAMRALPVAGCSGLGARLGRFSLPRFHKTAVARLTANLERLLPEAKAEMRAALMRRNWENQGRLMTEFSVVHRIARDPERLRIEGGEHAQAAAGLGPVIFMGLHLGNWELIWPALVGFDLHPALNYAPPRSRARHWIARRTRRQAGIDLLPPGMSAVRPALKRLQAGGQVIIFCDEGLHGKIRGPFLGRPAHLDGNLALVARLARLTGAAICPVWTVRDEKDPTRFALTIRPALTLDPGAADMDQLTADVIRLNAEIEPVIRAHLDQWYFLDSAL